MTGDVGSRVLWLVRHGQSAGNAALDAAHAAGSATIDLPSRDVDVPLSPLGERQAAALGRFFSRLSARALPTIIITSPYERARRTAEIAMATAGIHIATRADERLREREFGWFDGLTSRGIVERFPEEAARRSLIGKFYYRPPGGESWCDVFLRVRSLLDSLAREHPGESILIVAHQVVVLGFRYVLEVMTEEQILQIDRAGNVANCSVTTYSEDPRTGKLSLGTYNDVAPVAEAGEYVTRSPDAAAEHR